MTKPKHYKYGDVREDGYIFLKYYQGRTGATLEHWMNPESWHRAKRKRAADIAKWRQDNPDKHLRRRRAYREKHAELQRIFKKENPELRLMHASKRRALMAGSPVENSAMIRDVYQMRDRVSKCTGLKWHVDHIKPISRGGAHHHVNLQVIPATINLRKGSK